MSRTFPFHFAPTEELDLGRFDTPSIPGSMLRVGTILRAASSVFVRHEEYPSYRDLAGCVPMSSQ